MKKKTIVVLCIILIVLLGLGWFTYKQWNNISAVIDAFRYSREDIEKQLEDNKKTVEDFLAQEENITVRDLTEEESKALNEGNLTEEEVIELLVGTATEQPQSTASVNASPDGNKNPSVNTSKPTEGTATAAPQQSAAPTPADESAQKIAKAIARLYVQKSAYLGKLDVLEAQVIAEFEAIPYKEREDNDNSKLSQAKQALLKKYLPMVADWETECDNVVGGIIDEIRTELKNSGKDTGIADTLYESYLNEKKTKKAYFINRYMD